MEILAWRRPAETPLGRMVAGPLLSRGLQSLSTGTYLRRPRSAAGLLSTAVPRRSYEVAKWQNVLTMHINCNNKQLQW
jgi:hypothetical protein